MTRASGFHFFNNPYSSWFLKCWVKRQIPLAELYVSGQGDFEARVGSMEGRVKAMPPAAEWKNWLSFQDLQSARSSVSQGGWVDPSKHQLPLEQNSATTVSNTRSSRWKKSMTDRPEDILRKSCSCLTQECVMISPHTVCHLRNRNRKNSGYL